MKECKKREPCTRGVGGGISTKALLHETVRGKTRAFAAICVSASVDGFTCPSRKWATKRRPGLVDFSKRCAS